MCTSVNECICHGIPDSRQLKDGDIVNIDVTVYLNVSFCDFVGIVYSVVYATCMHWPLQISASIAGHIE